MIQLILTSCALILAVLGLRFVLKGKISLRLQYALWAVVLVRLLLPVTFGESPVSAANLSRPVQPVVQQMETVQIPVQSFDSAYEEVVQEHIQQGADISGFENTEELEYEAYEKMEKISLADVLLWVWIAGMGLCFAALLVSNLHFESRLRKSRRPIEMENAPLPVYCAPQIATPCLFGLFRPAIYVTEDVLSMPVSLNHVLTHEHTHFRHGDHIWSALRGLCLCIHWYNPLVWIAAKVSRSDAELACDEAAIHSLGEENRLDYGRTLIGLTCAENTSPLLTATMMTGSKHSIKERITLIAKKQRFSAAAVIVLILALAITAGCTFTGANETANYKDLAFPGTHWGMTIEQVKEALELTDQEVTITYDENSYRLDMDAQLENVFGAPALVTFRFTKFASNFPDYAGLTDIWVVYPDETDMDQIRTKLSREYGTPTVADAPPHLNLGRLENSEGHVSRWDSRSTLGDYMSDAYIDYYANLHASSGIYEHGLKMAEEAKLQPAAQLWWSDDSNWMTSRPGGGLYSNEGGQKVLYFSAGSLAIIRMMEDTDFLRQIPMDDSMLSSISYPVRMPVLRSVIAQEQIAGIPVVESKINVREIPYNAHSTQENYALYLYEVTWQVRPETTEGIILHEDEVLKDGWIIPVESTYCLVERSHRVRASINGYHYEDVQSIRLKSLLSASELESTYGTEEMLVKYGYGDMYTALAMVNSNGELELGPAANSLDYGVCAFPGTEWGMSPEEMFRSLGLTEADFTLDQDNFVYSREYPDVFGAPATVSFRFQTITHNDTVYNYLDRTVIEYADDTDMEMVKRSIISQYGEPAIADAPSMNYGWVTDKKGSEGHNSLWVSDATMGDFMNDSTMDVFILMTKASIVQGENWYEDALAELEEEKTDPAATIWWTDDSHWLMTGKAGDEPGRKCIVLDPRLIDGIRAYVRAGIDLSILGEKAP